MTMELYDRDGNLLKTVKPVVTPTGSFVGSIKDIFDMEVMDGYVKVLSNTPVSGYGVQASNASFTSVAAQKASTQLLVSPHFFVDQTGFDTTLRILNTKDESRLATVRCFDDNGEMMAEVEVNLDPNQMKVLSGKEILNLTDKKINQAYSGYLEVSMSDEQGQIATSVNYSSPKGKSATTVPMLRKAYDETIFPQIAQTLDNSLYTGLVILNPHDEYVTLTIEAYGPDGVLNQQKEIDVAPRSRLVNMLRSDTFFGWDYQQIKGHVRVKSSSSVFTYAAFGDASGQFLATVQGQKLLRD